MIKSTRCPAGGLLDTACAVWGGFLILFNVVVLSSDDGFIPGGALLLLISLAAGAGFLSALWLHRRSGYLVLALAVLWFLVVAWFRRDDATRRGKGTRTQTCCGVCTANSGNELAVSTHD